MTDNVVWGTDFKANKASYTIFGDPLGTIFFVAKDGLLYRSDPPIDTSPSEYTAPADDCA